MKKLLFICVIGLLGSSLQAQDGIVKFFENYMDDEQFTTVYISGKMFSMIADITEDEEDPELSNVIKKLKGLRILSSDSIPNGIELYNKAIKTFQKTEFEELMRIRDGEENVLFLIKETDDIINELILLVGEPNGFTMISFIGSLDLKQLSKLSNSMDIDGLDHLDKLGDEDGE